MIENMKAVCVVTQASQKDVLLDTLRELGVVHVAEKQEADPAVLQRLSVLSRLLQDLTDYADPENAAAYPLTDEQFEAICQNSAAALERKAVLSAKRTELLLEAEKLRPWGDFDSRQLNDLPKDMDLHFYRLDKKAYKALFKDENIRFLRLSPVEQMETVAVLGKLDGSVNAIEFVIPEKGPSQLKEEILACDKELSDCDRTLKEAAKHLTSYHEQLLQAQNDAAYSSVSQSLGKDDDLVWLRGYIPETEAETFVQTAKKRQWAWLIGDVEDDDTFVPTKIRYSKLTSLVKPIFDILGVVPGYREYDISFWFLAFFSLFFAIIIGDAGYGALFLVAAVLFHLKAKKTTNITLLLYLLSAATVVWGSLTGTWFGLEAAMQIPLLKALVIPSLANYPQHFGVETVTAQNNVMRFCFSIGVIQLALACIMNIRRRLIQKSLAWLADVGWLLSISALYLLVLNLVIGETINLAVTGTVIGAGFLAVIVFGGMEAGKSFSQGLKAGLGNAFTVFLNTISAFGNIMSYIRLFAVGMASLAIAQSFNGMAAGFDGALLIVGAVIMIIGHALNIVMGFLSVVVHGVRLNLLEFSGQLGMEWSGIAYEPFQKIKKTKENK